MKGFSEKMFPCYQEMQEKQEARAHLRKRFLGFLARQDGKHVGIKMLEGDRTLSATFRSCDAALTQVVVSDLETGLGKQKTARIRVSDSLFLSFKNE